MTRSPIRLAVWGLGRHAADKIVPAVAAADGLDLYGVCSRDAGTVAAVARTWACEGWTDPAAMLADPKVEAVYIATPIALHFEQAEAAFVAGKHVWCEKPLTSRLHDTQKLVELSRQLTLSLCEGHMYLYHPQFVQLARYVSSGRFGPLLSVAFRFGIATLAQPGFRTNPVLGGGAFLDVGCYPVSALDALFPRATHTVRYASSSSRDGAPVDTDGYAVIEVSHGPLAILEWRIDAAYRNEADIWGERGSVFTDKIFSKPTGYRPEFHIRDTHGVESTELVESANHFVLMLRYFRDVSSDTAAMETERQRISRRAELLDKIAAALR